MDSFCDELRASIGQDLRAVGAVHIQDTRSGQGFDKTEVCFFSACNKVIAIGYSPRNGRWCFIGEAESADLSQYETWDSLWHLLDMDKDTDTLEGLDEYLEMFPKEPEEFMKFIGSSLVDYFGRIR